MAAVDQGRGWRRLASTDKEEAATCVGERGVMAGVVLQRRLTTQIGGQSRVSRRQATIEDGWAAASSGLLYFRRYQTIGVGCRRRGADSLVAGGRGAGGGVGRRPQGLTDSAG
ncbi:hypothetical protein Dimus_037889 [Dionaea muscipula]